MIRKTRTLGALVGVLTLGSLAACGGSGSGAAAESDCVVKIGSIFSQTGAASAFGSDGERSIKMAIDEVNADGFEVDGNTCTFDYKATDLASDPNNAASVAQDLITGFEAQFVFGPDMAAAVPPVATAVQRDGDVMLLSLSTGMDAYAGKGEPFFRLNPTDVRMVNEGYIPAVAEQLPDVKRLAMLMTDDEVGRALAEGYADAFEKAGIEVVQTEYFDPTTTNFAPIAQRVDDGVDGFFIGYNNDGNAAGIIDAAIEAGLPPVVITRGISALPGADRIDKLDAYTWLVIGADPLYPATDEQKAFNSKFMETFDIEEGRMTYFPYSHYDYVGMLVQAMKEAGSTTDIAAISDALKGATYEGVLPVSFDDEGLNTTPMGLGVIRDGEGNVVTFGGN